VHPPVTFADWNLRMWQSIVWIHVCSFQWDCNCTEPENVTVYRVNPRVCSFQWNCTEALDYSTFRFELRNIQLHHLTTHPVKSADYTSSHIMWLRTVISSDRASSYFRWLRIQFWQVTAHPVMSSDFASSYVRCLSIQLWQVTAHPVMSSDCASGYFRWLCIQLCQVSEHPIMSGVWASSYVRWLRIQYIKWPPIVRMEGFIILPWPIWWEPGPPGWGSLKWDSKIWSWVPRDFDPRVTALARPKSNCKVNYRPVLSSERALQNNKHATVWRKFQGERKIGHRFQMGAWHQDRLADWL
jgi:hypothetical protein